MTVGRGEQPVLLRSQGAHHVFGELRCAGGIIQGDVNGDGHADFEIHVNLATLQKTDFML
jgi:hypothetical protein